MMHQDVNVMQSCLENRRWEAEKVRSGIQTNTPLGSEQNKTVGPSKANWGKLGNAAT